MAFSVLIKNERAKLQGWTNARQLGASYALFRKELQGKVACMLSLFGCKDEVFFLVRLIILSARHLKEEICRSESLFVKRYQIFATYFPEKGRFREGDGGWQ